MVFYSIPPATISSVLVSCLTSLRNLLPCTISLVVQNDENPRNLPGQSDEPGMYRPRIDHHHHHHHHHLPEVKSEGTCLVKRTNSACSQIMSRSPLRSGDTKECGLLCISDEVIQSITQQQINTVTDTRLGCSSSNFNITDMKVRHIQHTERSGRHSSMGIACILHKQTRSVLSCIIFQERSTTSYQLNNWDTGKRTCYLAMLSHVTNKIIRVGTHL